MGVTLAQTPPRLPDGWRHRPAKAREHWVVGVDLGQSTDPTAVSVVRHVATPVDDWTPLENSRVWKQSKQDRYDVLHLERFPLGISYIEQVARVRDILARPPLAEISPRLVIDETGVGRPCGDLFDAHGMSPLRVTITAGLEVIRAGARSWHVPKQFLVSRLDAALHTGSLKIAAAIADAPALREELKEFQRSISAAGRATYAARVGRHDDLVLSVAISLFAIFEASGELVIEELRI